MSCWPDASDYVLSVDIGHTSNATIVSRTGDCHILYPYDDARIFLRRRGSDSDDKGAFLREWRMFSPDTDYESANRAVIWIDTSALADAAHVRVPELSASGDGMPRLDETHLHRNGTALLFECDVHETVASALADADAYDYASVSLWPGTQRFAADADARPKIVPSSVTLYMAERFSLFGAPVPAGGNGSVPYLPTVGMAGDVAPSCAYGSGLLAQVFDSGRAACIYMALICTAFIAFMCFYVAVLCVWRCVKRCRHPEDDTGTGGSKTASAQVGAAPHPSSWRDYVPHNSAVRITRHTWSGSTDYNNNGDDDDDDDNDDIDNDGDGRHAEW